MIKSWFDVGTTQVFKFIIFLSAGDLFESAFSLWVPWSHSQKIINLSLLAACVASCPYCSGFWSEKPDRSKCYKEFDFEKSIVSLVEICLHETVNNQHKQWTLEFEIKESNIMTIRTKKTQSIEHLNNEKCQTTRVEQKRLK